MKIVNRVFRLVVCAGVLCILSISPLTRASAQANFSGAAAPDNSSLADCLEKAKADYDRLKKLCNQLSGQQKDDCLSTADENYEADVWACLENELQGHILF